MKLLSKITVVVLLALTAAVLVINFQYLYIAPIANSWVYWRGDETWLMSQYFQFVRTGHYINPLAPGSVFSQCSGLLFGSCYLTASLYGLPLLFIKGHTINIGRTVTYIFGSLTLVAVWLIARRYRVGPVLSALGCLLLAATLCFFITSHSARSDMLIGFTILTLTGYLPLLVKNPYPYRAALLGLLLPLCLLVNGHVLIDSFLMLGYLIWAVGGFKSKRSLLQWTGAAVGGFACLFIAQAALLDSESLFGPFSNGTSMVPIMRLLHAKSDLANFDGRLHVATVWAPGLLWISVVILVVLVWARFAYNIRLSRIGPERLQLIICAACVILSSIFIEFYQDQYFIYVLPTIVLSFLVVLSYLITTLPRVPVVVLTAALSVCLALALWRYGIDSVRLGNAGETITMANKRAVMDALAAVHSQHAGRTRIFSTTAGQYLAMDDSCELVTPVIYMQPNGSPLSRSDVWNRAKIDYAIVFNTIGGGDWDETDSTIEWSARSRAKVIFERVGPFTDILRTYSPSDRKWVDTLRVYEF